MVMAEWCQRILNINELSKKKYMAMKLKYDEIEKNMSMILMENAKKDP